MSCTGLYWPNAKTKFLSKRIEALGLRKTLFVSGASVVDEGFKRAIRNIPSVKLVTTAEANIYELLKWPRVVLDLKAVEFYEQTLKRRNIPPPIIEQSTTNHIEVYNL